MILAWSVLPEMINIDQPHLTVGCYSSSPNSWYFRNLIELPSAAGNESDFALLQAPPKSSSSKDPAAAAPEPAQPPAPDAAAPADQAAPADAAPADAAPADPVAPAPADAADPLAEQNPAAALETAEAPALAEAPVAEPAQPAVETLTPEQRKEKDQAKEIKGETSCDVVAGIYNDLYIIL